MVLLLLIWGDVRVWGFWHASLYLYVVLDLLAFRVLMSAVYWMFPMGNSMGDSAAFGLRGDGLAYRTCTPTNTTQFCMDRHSIALIISFTLLFSGLLLGAVLPPNTSYIPNIEEFHLGAVRK